jgi:steroid delta-isomerase-like uncharacterized protein
MADSRNAEVVRSLYEAFNQRDLARALANLAEDCTLEDVALGQTFRGRDGFRQWLFNWATGLPDARAELTRLLVADDWVVTEHVGRGTHSGPLRGPTGVLEPTGYAIQLNWAELFQLRDGQIRLMRAYWDAAALLRQVGLIA